uniref:Enolase-phosphatase E1-like n=1 Tax=Saccoglossus kowalevskii TaxID=10224 RepID=A0ABM0MPT3_SACKO|nr:PREDICTED: enolase-phosphatase E1-like [Saccoglossus kowalevskii]
MNDGRLPQNFLEAVKRIPSLSKLTINSNKIPCNCDLLNYVTERGIELIGPNFAPVEDCSDFPMLTYDFSQFVTLCDELRTGARVPQFTQTESSMPESMSESLGLSGDIAQPAQPKMHLPPVSPEDAGGNGLNGATFHQFPAPTVQVPIPVEEVAQFHSIYPADAAQNVAEPIPEEAEPVGEGAVHEAVVSKPVVAETLTEVDKTISEVSEPVQETAESMPNVDGRNTEVSDQVTNLGKSYEAEEAVAEPMAAEPKDVDVVNKIRTPIGDDQFHSIYPADAAQNVAESIPEEAEPVGEGAVHEAVVSKPVVAETLTEVDKTISEVSEPVQETAESMPNVDGRNTEVSDQVTNLGESYEAEEAVAEPMAAEPKDVDVVNKIRTPIRDVTLEKEIKGVLENLQAASDGKVAITLDINDPYELGLLLRYLRKRSELLQNIGNDDVKEQVLKALDDNNKTK